MKETRIPAFYGRFAMGLHEGYACGRIWSVGEVHNELALLQAQLKKSHSAMLSCNCFESVVVMGGQREPHLNFHFINYPRFPLEESVFKQHVLFVAQELMRSFCQNRIVVEFSDELVMIEESDAVDPTIYI